MSKYQIGDILQWYEYTYTILDIDDEGVYIVAVSIEPVSEDFPYHTDGKIDRIREENMHFPLKLIGKYKFEDK